MQWNLGLSWTTLYHNSYCKGEFGYDRMGLAGDNIEECRESATLDSYCSHTLYYCSPGSGFQCRCVMKDRQCNKDTVDSYSCTVERKSRFRYYISLFFIDRFLQIWIGFIISIKFRFNYIDCWVNSSTDDSNLCLQNSPRWSTETCAGSKKHCTDWQKDMWRCCPQTCRQGVPLTEADCMQLTVAGTCTYPFTVEPHKCSLDIGNKDMKNWSYSFCLNYWNILCILIYWCILKHYFFPSI